MSTLQKHWDIRAALNFMLGGSGTGLMIATVFFLPQKEIPALLSLALVAAGLGAVWLAIGRKLRAVHVFFNPFTSWMTRESFFALLLFVFSGFFFFSKNQYLLYAASLAALAFLFSQGRILRASKGIPVWRVPQVVPLILATGLAEGFGLALLFQPRVPLLAVFAVLVALRIVAWRHYWGAVRAPSLEPAGRTLLMVGTIGALALAAAAWAAPALAPLAGLAGLAAAASGWRMKHALVTRAAFKQKFFLPHLPVRGTR